MNDANVTPELNQSLRDPNRLAEARDVFTLGIVLWQISEEVRRFHRWQRSELGIGKGLLPNGLEIWLTVSSSGISNDQRCTSLQNAESGDPS